MQKESKFDLSKLTIKKSTQGSFKSKVIIITKEMTDDEYEKLFTKRELQRIKQDQNNLNPLFPTGWQY